MLLQASMSFSVTLARFTLQLNRRPDLTRRIRSVDEDSGGKSVAESSAEIIQKIFTTCLTDRSVGRVPEGKKVGVYMFANLVLKLLFACRRTNLAKMIFVNISTISPPLSLYPASQRVTFLYYLGRFNFSNQHYQRAALCLEQAYLQTPPPLVSHRTNILTYLIPCNILLGRFPSGALMQRPEAATLKSVFVPLCEAVRVGNFIQFQHHLSTHETWLFEKGLLLALTHRLRPLLWRSLARKTFVFTYVPPADASSRKAATLDIRPFACSGRLCAAQTGRLAPLPSKRPGQTVLAGKSIVYESCDEQRPRIGRNDACSSAKRADQAPPKRGFDLGQCRDYAGRCGDGGCHAGAAGPDAWVCGSRAGEVCDYRGEGEGPCCSGVARGLAGHSGEEVRRGF
ncbi:hypothetical protein J3458_001995 [Metarhizium acridum]|uniref:uncharacterized protein n=1 Tax=Metarhizium acridum TaxID=92637 RepID=UPI001C6AFDEF|nr:hypothetical protein J3458_001995 [Metarhizium acridum]